jgi:hypothetical protein
MIISRRTITTGLLVLIAAPALPPLASGAMPTVSPRMASLIADYKRLTDALAAIDPQQDFEAWADAADAVSPALTALANERPVNLVDYAAKFSALVDVTEGDDDFYILRRLLDDVRALAGVE